MAAEHDIFDFAAAQGASPYPELDEVTIKTFWDVAREFRPAFELVRQMRFAPSRAGHHWWQHLPDEGRWIAPLGEFTNFTHVRNLGDFLADPHAGLPPGNVRLATDAIDATDPRVFERTEHFAWFQSPVCRTHASPEELYASLTKKRRDRLKNTVKRSRFDLRNVEQLHDPLKHCDLMRTWLRARWLEDSDYAFALLQLCWSLAVEQTRPHLMRWIGHFSGEAPVPDAVAYFQVQPSPEPLVTFQGIVSPFEDAGAVMLTGSSVLLHTAGTQILDPTCRTIFTEHSSDTYKRAIINEDRLRPVLYAARGKIPQSVEAPYWNAGTWVTPSTGQKILFEGI